MRARWTAGVAIFLMGFGIPLALSLAGNGASNHGAAVDQYCEGGGISVSTSRSTSTHVNAQTASQGVAFAGGGGPELGRTVGLVPVSGTVTYKEPGQAFFTRLLHPLLVPVSTLVDTRQGRVEIISATDFPQALHGTSTTRTTTTRTPHTHTHTVTTPCTVTVPTVTSDSGLTGMLHVGPATAQAATTTTTTGFFTPTRTGEFFDGLFRVLQERFREAPTVTRLAGPLAGCSDKKSTAPTSGRRLWGDAHGFHTTIGRRSSAAVRGTKWLVQDRCDGSTLTKVKHGVVAVRDFATGSTTDVGPGGRHIAR